MSELCVVVANYDFNENALALRHLFKQSFPTYLIDASSPRPLDEADFTIPNTYYPGLWNKAVEIAVENSSHWLLFVASDVIVQEPEMLINCIKEAASDPNIALWTPSLTPNSRYYFKECGHNSLTVQRKTLFVEGFFFMARIEVLKQQHQIPDEFKDGWNVDVITSAMSLQIGNVVIDDRVQIYHPKSKQSHAINEQEAIQEGLQYRQRFSESVQSQVIHNLAKADQFSPDIFPPTSLASHWI